MKYLADIVGLHNGEGVGDMCDNCINTANIDQTDVTSDGVGDAWCNNCPDATTNSDEEEAAPQAHALNKLILYILYYIFWIFCINHKN